MSALPRSTSILHTCLLLLAVHGLHFSSGPASGAPKKLTLSELAIERRKDCPARIDTKDLPPVWVEDKRQGLLNVSRRRSNTSQWPTSTQPSRHLFGNAALYPKKQCVSPPVTAPTYCPLLICKHAGAIVPRIFVDLLPDDEAQAVLNIMEGLLVANENGMNFGGVLPMQAENSLAVVASDTLNVVNTFFNLTNPQWLFWSGPPPCFKGVFQSVTALESSRPNLNDGENVYLPLIKELSPLKYAEYMDSEFLMELRWALQRYRLSFRPNELTVAMHVVRDKRPWQGAFDTRYNYYFEMAKSIRKMYPKADIHAFSSNFAGMYRLWNTTDLEGFKTHGITLHLDECNTVDTWAHMSFAHVFVLSREATAFSKIPAMLNPNCVVYSSQDEERFRAMKRKHLLGSNSGRLNFLEDLRAAFEAFRLAGAVQDPPGFSRFLQAGHLTADDTLFATGAADLLVAHAALVDGHFQQFMRCHFGAAFRPAPPKRKARMLEKLAADMEELPPFGSPEAAASEEVRMSFFLLGDVVRGAVEADGAEAMLQTLDKLHSLPPGPGGATFEAWRVKNTHHPDAATVGGYRDVKVLGCFRVPAPPSDVGAGDMAMVVEIQVIDAEFLNIKHFMHKVYAVKRGDFWEH